MQLHSQTTIFFVISGLKIEQTGPETAKISPKIAKKKTIFDPKKHFFGQMWSVTLKLGQKNGNGELFAAAGPNNIFFGQIRAKNQKNRSRNS